MVNGPGTITVLDVDGALRLTGRFPGYVVPPARAEEIHAPGGLRRQPAIESSSPDRGGSGVAERSPNVVNKGSAGYRSFRRIRPERSESAPHRFLRLVSSGAVCEFVEGRHWHSAASRIRALNVSGA